MNDVRKKLKGKFLRLTVAQLNRLERHARRGTQILCGEQAYMYVKGGAG